MTIYSNSLLSKPINPYKLIFSICFAYIILGAFHPLILPDEGRYVSVALEMLLNQDFSTPTLNGLPFFHKPPLFYWLTAASLKIFGLHAWNARLVNTLAAALSMLALYVFTRKFKTANFANTSILILASMPLFFGGAQYADLNILVATCISVSVLAFSNAILSSEHGQAYRWSLIIAFIFAGLGFLSKGLIGAALPFSIIFIWLIASKRYIKITYLFYPYGLGIFFAIVLPWLIQMQSLYPGFYHYFFIYQHFQRFIGESFNNKQSFLFYFVVLFVLNLPWTWHLYKMKSIFKNMTTPRQTINQDIDIINIATDIKRLMLIWLLFVLIFFSIPSSKLVGYILPCMVPLAYLITCCFKDHDYVSIEDKKRQDKTMRNTYIIAMILIISMPCLLIYQTIKQDGSTYLHINNFPYLEMRKNDSIIMYQNYLYDYKFYLPIQSNAYIIHDWHNVDEIKKHDNWAKEILDAGEFNPQLAQKLLIDKNDTPAIKNLICQNHVSWLIAKQDVKDIDKKKEFKDLLPVLVYSNKKYSLWRFSNQLAPYCLEHKKAKEN